MPLFNVRIERSVTEWQNAYLVIQAEDQEAAEKTVTTMIQDGDEDLDAIEWWTGHSEVDDSPEVAAVNEV